MVRLFDNIRRAMSAGQNAEPLPSWHTLGDELSAAFASGEPRLEAMILEILKFDKRLSLDETANLPHRASPENVLKSLAVQYLARMSGGKFAPTMRRILLIADPSFGSIIRGVLKRIDGGDTFRPRTSSVPDATVPNAQAGRQPARERGVGWIRPQSFSLSATGK